MTRLKPVLPVFCVAIVLLFSGCTPNDARIVAREVYGLELSDAQAKAVAKHHVQSQAPQGQLASVHTQSIPDRIIARWMAGGASRATGERAMRIARCESRFNNFAQNARSTAYGLFQFLNATWRSTGISKTSDIGLQIEAAFRLWRQRGFQPWVCRG